MRRPVSERELWGAQAPQPLDDELAGTWERLLCSEAGEALLERRDVWGFADDDVNAPRNRGLRYG